MLLQPFNHLSRTLWWTLLLKKAFPACVDNGSSNLRGPNKSLKSDVCYPIARIGVSLRIKSSVGQFKMYVCLYAHLLEEMEI